VHDQKSNASSETIIHHIESARHDPRAAIEANTRDTLVRRVSAMLLLAYLVCCVAAALISYPRRPSGLISSDGKGYYAWLRTLAIDHDLDFRNDFELLYPPEPLPPEIHMRTSRGLVPDKYPVGVALIEVPGFIIGHVAAAMSNFPLDGVSAPYQIAITIWLQIFCVAGIAALWHGLRRVGVDARVATLTVGSALCATNVVQYIASPTMSHGPGLAVLCLTFLAIVAAGQSAKRTGRLSLVGALAGLAIIVRPSNIAFAPFFLVFLYPVVRRSAVWWVAVLGGFLAVLAVQIAMTSLLWGQLAFTGYTQEHFDAGVQGVAGTLFAARHGLFVYHPWYLLMIAACAFAARLSAHRPVAFATLASVTILAVINGTWSTWWFGDSFGNRAFVEAIAPLTVAVSLWITSIELSRRSRVIAATSALTVALSLLNLYLWVGFIMHRYPANGAHTLGQAYEWPLSH
jgi:hypothetical protein